MSDKQKRANYDQFGHAANDPNFGGGGGGFGGFGGFDIDLEDILGNMFGGGFGGGSARRNGPKKGRNIEVEVSLDFEEAVFGVKKQVSFMRVEDCANSMAAVQKKVPARQLAAHVMEQGRCAPRSGRRLAHSRQRVLAALVAARGKSLKRNVKPVMGKGKCAAK